MTASPVQAKGTLADLDRLGWVRVTLEERVGAVLEQKEARDRRVELANITQEIGRARDRLREEAGKLPLLSFSTLAAKQAASTAWTAEYGELRRELRERFGARV